MSSPAKLPDTRAFQRIVEYVERALAAGELKAGDRLPSERELVERFGVGRSSVREALRVLLARETLYAHYADQVEPADRAIMADLVRECGGRVPV
jgi:GntR family transcriptional regulator, transcriptional repressor for pyruvate dehydrogenase complex